jgi:hydrogenase maturation factor
MATGIDGTIHRQNVYAACTALGLDPKEIVSIHIEGTVVTVVTYDAERKALGKTLHYRIEGDA